MSKWKCVHPSTIATPKGLTISPFAIWWQLLWSHTQWTLDLLEVSDFEISWMKLIWRRLLTVFKQISPPRLELSFALETKVLSFRSSDLLCFSSPETMHGSDRTLFFIFISQKILISWSFSLPETWEICTISPPLPTNCKGTCIHEQTYTF